MKLLIAFEKNGKSLLKIRFDDGQEKWAVTSQAVVNYAKTILVKDAEGKFIPLDAIFEMTEKNGQYTVSKIITAGGATASQAPATTTSAPKCSDCGKDLKDAKYKKCWECNKKAPVTQSGAEKPQGGRTDAVGTSIEKQAMMKASANAVALAMQGQISDVTVLGDLIVALYERLYVKLTA